MPSHAPPKAEAVPSEGDKARETLSQFVARVLSQLSLSAWLPATALLLLLILIFQIDAAFNDKDLKKPHDPMHVVGRAITALGAIRVGGAVVLLVGVVVLTVVTQAFSFEAIRVLEGYWGTNRLVEWVAWKRCRHFKRVRRRLSHRHRAVTKQALRTTIRAIQREDTERVKDGKSVVWTPEMFEVLRAGVPQKDTPILLNNTQDDIVTSIGVRTYATSDQLRRQLNLDKRLRDFPEAKRILPTRFGNVLRHHEDVTGRDNLESFVNEIFDGLPPDQRSSHDELRTRLDLYCSMVFVLLVVTAVAAARFMADSWGYAATAACAGATGTLLMNRAAVASARGYGALLITISRQEADRQAAATAAAPSPPEPQPRHGLLSLLLRHHG